MTAFAQLLVSGLALGAIYALLAVSFSLVVAAVGVWNFASAGVYTLAAFVVWVLLDHGVAFALACVVALAAGGLLMLACDVLVHEPLRRRGATTEIVMIGSLTLTILVTALVGMTWGSESHAYPGNLLDGTVKVGQIVITHWHFAAVGTGIVVLAVLGFILDRTHFGRAIRSYGDNPELTVALGERRARPHLGAYVLSTLAIVPAGVLVGIRSGVNPDMGLDALLLASAAAILGGLGNMWAAATGGLVLGVVTNVPLLWLSPAWQSPIAFGILLATILARPQGLFRGAVVTGGI